MHFKIISFTLITKQFTVINAIGICPSLSRKMSKCIFNLIRSPGQLGRSSRGSYGQKTSDQLHDWQQV